jgi:hypothetical protein
MQVAREECWAGWDTMTSRPGTQCLRLHQAFNAMQSAALTKGQHVVPDTTGTVGPVAAHKALPHLHRQGTVFQAAPALGPHKPGTEATSRDTSASHTGKV